MKLLLSISILKIRKVINYFSIAGAMPTGLFVLFCMLCYQKTFAGCTGAPSYNVNLTGHPDTTWTSPSITRSGTCCSSSNCAHFTVTLDPSAAGVIVSISGATGATTYIINCGTVNSYGSAFCITGTGPWEIDFCKPGANSQSYSFQSVSAPYVPHKTVYITSGCQATLAVKNLTLSTITWTSLSGSTYNSRLSCTSACDSTYVSTGASFPSYVNYEVCGTPLLSCYGSFCDTIKVVYIGAVSVSVSPKPASVCSGDSLKLTATISGGKSPYTYSWSNGSTLSYIYVKTAGKYKVKVTDSLNCTRVYDSVTLTVNPLPAAAVISNATICTGSSISIGATAVGGSTYSWTSNPAGLTSTLSNPAVSPIITTTYTLTETNSNGCVKSSSVIVTVNPIPSASVISNTAICSGASISIGASSTAGHTYSWISIPSGFTSTSSNPTVNPVVSTTYTITETITATGCSKSNSVVITVNALPAASVIANTAICSGTSISIGASSTGGHTYSWVSVPSGFTSTSSNPLATPVINTTYTLTEIITLTGCSKSNSVVITVNALPAASVIANTAICSGTSISIGASSTGGHTYSWGSVPSGFTSTSSNPLATPVINTAYTLTEIITLTGCSKSNSVVITVNALPAASVIANTAICSGTSISIGASSTGGHTYSWVSVPSGFTATSSNPSVTPVINTTYTLTEIITLTGCSKSNSVAITVNALPAASVIANTAICVGASLPIGGSAIGGSTYSWTSSPSGFTSTSSNPTVSPILTTTYTLTETNSSGCVKANSATIMVNPLPNPAISGNNSTCENTSGNIYTTASNSGDTYSWTTSGGTMQTGQGTHTISVDWNGPGTGIITVTEVTTSGCSKAVQYNVTIFAKPGVKLIAHW